MLITTLSGPGRTVSYWIRILGNLILLMNWSHPDNGMKRPLASLGCCLSPPLSQSLGFPWAWHMACPFPLSASFLVLFGTILSSIFTWPHIATACSASHCLWIYCKCIIWPMLSMALRPPTAFRCFLGYGYTHQKNPGSVFWLTVARWIWTSAAEHHHPI